MKEVPVLYLSGDQEEASYLYSTSQLVREEAPALYLSRGREEVYLYSTY